MLSQLMAKMLSGHSVHVFRVTLVVSLVFMSGTALGEDFKILLVRVSGIDQSSGKPAGRLVVNGGYLNGIEEGQSGVVWRKNKYKGQLEIADLTISEVGPYEAIADYVLRHPDLFVQKKDRIALTVTVHSDADIVARAVENLDNDHCFDALLYFERILCSNKDNEFLLKKVEECRVRTEKKLDRGGENGTGRVKQLDIWEQLEVAEGLHEFKNDLAADLYLKRIYSQDSTMTKARELRKMVPILDFSSLLSVKRCK